MSNRFAILNNLEESTGSGQICIGNTYECICDNVNIWAAEQG
jgi:hypothetical protein